MRKRGERSLQLPTHPTRTSRHPSQIRTHTHRAKATPEPLRDRPPQGHALRTGAHGVARVLDVGAGDEGAVGGEEGGADAEVGVRRVGGGLGVRCRGGELGEVGGGEGEAAEQGWEGGCIRGGEDLGLGRHDGGVGGVGRRIVTIGVL